MASTLRPLSNTLLTAPTRQPTALRSLARNNTRLLSAQQTRAFQLPNLNPFASSDSSTTPTYQTITTTRTLHYPASLIYEVISDVSSYERFIPYLQESSVTQWSSPASADGKRYPSEARLVVGYADAVKEELWSRVYCVPGRSVESVAGRTQPITAADETAHHDPRPAGQQDKTQSTALMTHLRSLWTLRPYHYKPPPSAKATLPGGEKENHERTSPLPGQERTEVTLVIEYAFANPLYGALSAGVSGVVAEKLVGAFEERVAAVLKGPGVVKEEKKA